MKRRLATYLFLAIALSLPSKTVTHDIVTPIHLSPNDTFTIAQRSSSENRIIAIETGIALDKGNGTWSISLEFNREIPSITCTLSVFDRNYGDFDHDKALKIVIRSGEETIFEKTYNKNVNLRNGANFIKAASTDNTIIISLGNRVLFEAAQIPCPADISSAIVKATDGSTIVRRIVTMEIPHKYSDLDILSIEDARDKISRSSDRFESLWQLYDSEIDTDYSRRGGNYILATLRNGNIIEIIYIDGASINPNLWKAGMIKGCLTPTATELDFDLQWFDAEFKDDTKDASASFDPNGVYMTLSFPYDKATLRFIRIK